MIDPIQGTFPRAPSQAARLLDLVYDVRRDFGASGSDQTTTGSITAGSNILTLTEPIDFQDGQGILILGAGSASTLATPAAPTVTVEGTTGTSTWGYAIAFRDPNLITGTSAASSPTTITTGASTLSTTDYNQITWTYPSGVSLAAVYRTASPDTTTYPLGLIGFCGGSATFQDVGQAPITQSLWDYAATPPTAPMADPLIATIVSGGGTTTLVLSASATTSVSGAVVLHQDQLALQNALYAQQETGIPVYIPPGVYHVYGPLQFTANGGNAQFDARLIGAGMFTSIIRAVAAGFGYQGILGYSGDVNARVVATDLCVDGNWFGVDTGHLGPGYGSPGLVVLAMAFETDQYNGERNGLPHQFTRCRFYRSVAFGFFGMAAAAYNILQCCFDGLGQPVSPTAWVQDYGSADNIGGGSNPEALVFACVWRRSQGSYVDFVSSTNEGARVTFIGNVANTGSSQGGVYAFGDHSIIAANFLKGPTAAGVESGITYDASSSVRTPPNLVIGNVLEYNLSTTNADEAGDYTPANRGAGSPLGAITPPASPLVSGTVYQNTATVPITIYQPAYASTAGTAGTVAVALGATDTPGTLYTQYIPGDSTSSAPMVCTLRVPAGWYYAFTTNSATLMDATIMGE